MNRLIEAMAMAVRGKLEERLLNARTAKDALEFAGELAQSALSALLATGSVVICTPELKALMGAVAGGSVSQVRRARVNWLATPQGTAFARAHQEDKG